MPLKAQSNLSFFNGFRLVLGIRSILFLHRTSPVENHVFMQQCGGSMVLVVSSTRGSTIGEKIQVNGWAL